MPGSFGHLRCEGRADIQVALSCFQLAVRNEARQVSRQASLALGTWQMPQRVLDKALGTGGPADFPYCSNSTLTRMRLLNLAL